MAYAAKTDVPVDRTRIEIERTLIKYGADRFAYMTEPGKAIIMFDAKDRRLRFDLPLPPKDASEQKLRTRWRALLLCIKAKLESVASGIETFEEAFLAHVMMGDGQTVYEHTRDRIEIAYKGGEVPPLLPAPRTAP